MNTKFKWLLFLTGVLLVASACNLFSTLLNPVDKAVSEIEDLATQVDVDQLEEELRTLATELPSTLEAIPSVDDLGDLGDIQATTEAFTESFTSGEAPEDIPRIDDRQDMLVSANIVSYSTPLSFDEALAFYQEQMPANEWDPNQDSTVISGDMALLTYEKPDRTAIVTLSEEDGKTIVLINIQEK